MFRKGDRGGKPRTKPSMSGQLLPGLPTRKVALSPHTISTMILRERASPLGSPEGLRLRWACTRRPPEASEAGCWGSWGLLGQLGAVAAPAAVHRAEQGHLLPRV